ncbi:hypothetical protein BTA51_15045 [Hahella sp. CCB-MM4]|uniref:DUF2946 family protein n=1 Tax=Hahella sp. (strain CCB-MM4) TaxID=1926491 RepID=UPI000B9B890B|nr:DUF2946 family protein [Hahella sp. CCB-MM4]OZG72441.1 hypothetical protein BTA51_15045 [Hahella sp. CCB-MM4]
MKGTPHQQNQFRKPGHQLLLTLLLSCLMLQALIPHGYMPGNLAAGDGALVFCGLDLSQNADNPDDNSQDSHYLAEKHNLCAFTSFAQSATLTSFEAPDLYISALTNSFTGYDPPSDLLTPHYILPLSRAPPVSPC